MNLDDALLCVGAYGRYQMMIYFAISFFDNFPSIWHMSVGTFLGYEPEHRCKIPAEDVDNCTLANVYNNKTEAWEVDKCHMYPIQNGTCATETEKCTEGYWYNPDPIQTSIVTDWDLVCDRNYLPELTQTVFNVGVMVGALFFGFSSDKYGRKKTFIGALLAQTVVGGITAAAPNFYFYTAFRFLVGALEQGVNITGFIMATELFPPKERSVMAVCHEFLWAIGGALLPFFAYFLRQWRHLQLVVSLPSILAIFLWWTVPESMVWLMAKGRVKEAEAILQKAAKMNGRHLPPGSLSDEADSKPIVRDQDGTTTVPADTAKVEVDGNVASPPDKDRTYTVIDLFRTPQLRKISICVCVLWALNTMVYYGLTFNTPNLYGDMYLNFFLGQMVEIPSVLATLFLIYRVGRRWPLCLFHVFGGIVCIASPFVPQETESGYNLQWLSVTLAMLGKFSINASFTIIYMYGPEIYPTVVRNTGAGLASFSGRFGGILYPQVTYLSKLDTPLAKQLPLIVFGVFSIIGGFSALPLPETRHRPLPQTIDDVENYDEFCKRAMCHENGNAHEMAHLPGSENKGEKV